MGTIRNKKWNKPFPRFSKARYQSPFWLQIILSILTHNISLIPIFTSFFLLCPLQRDFFVSSTSINNFHADLISSMCIIGSADIRFFAIIIITRVLCSSFFASIPLTTYFSNPSANLLWLSQRQSCLQLLWKRR